jgi:hypothetical protein
VEKRSLFGAFYWKTTVISTVGFGDIIPHTLTGNLLFIFDAVSGIDLYVYVVTSYQASIVDAQPEKDLGVSDPETNLPDKNRQT